MALQTGFYNSFGGDRKYNATHISKLFDGIIRDGVFATSLNQFKVYATTGMGFRVDTGRAWFNSTWLFNDDWLPMTCAASEAVFDRIDALVIEVNHELDVRETTLKYIKGTPAATAVKPTMVRSELVNQYPIAYFKITKSITAITSANIEIAVGSSLCPFVTAPLESIDIDAQRTQWEAEFSEWMQSEQSGFTSWFDGVKGQLSTDAAGNLQNQINAIDRLLIKNEFTLNNALCNANTWYRVAEIYIRNISVSNGIVYPVKFYFEMACGNVSGEHQRFLKVDMLLSNNVNSKINVIDNDLSHSDIVHTNRIKKIRAVKNGDYVYFDLYCETGIPIDAIPYVMSVSCEMNNRRLIYKPDSKIVRLGTVISETPTYIIAESDLVPAMVTTGKDVVFNGRSQFNEVISPQKYMNLRGNRSIGDSDSNGGWYRLFVAKYENNTHASQSGGGNMTVCIARSYGGRNNEAYMYNVSFRHNAFFVTPLSATVNSRLLNIIRFVIKPSTSEFEVWLNVLAGGGTNWWQVEFHNVNLQYSTNINVKPSFEKVTDFAAYTVFGDYYVSEVNGGIMESGSVVDGGGNRSYFTKFSDGRVRQFGKRWIPGGTGGVSVFLPVILINTDECSITTSIRNSKGTSGYADLSVSAFSIWGSLLSDNVASNRELSWMLEGRWK